MMVRRAGLFWIGAGVSVVQVRPLSLVLKSPSLLPA